MVGAKNLVKFSKQNTVLENSRYVKTVRKDTLWAVYTSQTSDILASAPNDRKHAPGDL